MTPDGYAIRPLVLDDAAALADAYVRNREHLARWDNERPEVHYTEEGQRQAVEQAMAATAEGRLDPHVITHGVDVVGRVTLANIVRGTLQSGVLGYWTDHAHLRRGLAAAATEYATARAAEIGLHRVEAGCRLDNVPSQRVLERCGYEEYGVARSFLFEAGAWRDMRLFQRILDDAPPSS